ncbi:hypothetical protein N5I84_00345 [Ralstonia sp. CHL-2022]|uniref:hypothetical protein n=1 Tax=Ralstonia mojiangensis TaxID=2953895 RepID=UPI0021B3127C|nr:hypothetical protein [Ralstonia mojiangensis]MCT7294600.1 hypothetical protein [Ralstonia mojiangensis]
MQDTDELAKQFGATVSRFRSLEIVSIPVRCDGPIDVAFRCESRIGRLSLFSILRRDSLGGNLELVGAATPVLAELVRSDVELCRALGALLNSNVYEVEWKNSSLSARINMWKGTLGGDVTGGRLLLTNLQTVSQHLEIVSKNAFSKSKLKYGNFGPKALKNIFIILSYVLPIIILISFFYFIRSGKR